MRLKTVLSSALLTALIGVVGIKAEAHSTFPVFSTHASIATKSALHSSLSGSLNFHSSGAQRAYSSLSSAYSAVGGKSALANFHGGNILGGALTGTGYGTVGGASSPLLYGGQGSLSFGTSPAGLGSNALYFVNATTTISPSPAPYLIGGFHLSGASRALIGNLNGAYAGGYNTTVKSFNGPVLGGELQGSGYQTFGGSYVGTGQRFLVAFGKDPLNHLGITGTPTLAGSASYITFANGLTKQISAGQILVKAGVQYSPASPTYALFIPGSVGSIGADPYNVFRTGQILAGAHNYLSFF